jgi:6-phosphofructokinase 1
MWVWHGRAQATLTSTLLLLLPLPCVVHHHLQVPKSIDNDVMLVDKTFGFDTVVQEVVTRPLLAAKTEAASARKGVGLVKVGLDMQTNAAHLMLYGN